ncbi:MAG TPA: NAD(P)-binding domain-containing protein [Micromonosporaceae bacterium]
MAENVDVAIVGAGPYGLSLAAHLRATGVDARVFGRPMRLWRDAMPAGMFLKSQPFASNLSDPDGAATLRAFCEATGQRYVPYGEPVSLERFTAYGAWFQRTQVPDVMPDLVEHLWPSGNGYELTLRDGERVRARRVVVATGVEHFAYTPPPLDTLPPTLCSHSSAHTDLGVFRGMDITVVGGGQSALETAALASERGATVRVLVRESTVEWNGEPLPDHRPLVSRLREPEAALGSGWPTWFYSTRPALFRRLPAHQRVRIARTALGPAGAHWLRPRIQDRIPVETGHVLTRAAASNGGVRLTVRHRGGESDVLTEHVIAGTGYRPDVTRLGFLDRSITSRIQTLDGAPVVGADFQSSVPGLYFVGPAVASSFGPVMRFVHGCDFAARRLSRRLALTAPRVLINTRTRS